MRGLGAPRTLVLLEGQRLSGDNDLSLVPSVLVSRVDVVTGSASAAWGSGAVAGVVNIVLDNKLEGLRVGAQGSLSDEDDIGEHRFEAAGGLGFADDRGHLIFGGEFVDNNGLQPKTLRPNAARWAVVANPAFAPGNGQSAFMLAPDVGIANVSPGGLILSGVNAGKTFNADGTLRTFDLGRVSGLNSIGGEAPSLDDVVALVAPYTRYAALTRATYAFSDSLRLTADLRHARAYTDYGLLPDASRGNITISINNAFLPAVIRNQMATAGETSFTMGRFNDDFAFLQLSSERQSTQATLALEGDIGAAWHWKASYSHGDYSEDFDVGNARITANFNRSVDSVINPADGQPACRVNTDANSANDDPNCVPINLFGQGAPSQQARNYVTATSFSHTQRLLDTASLSLRGEPFDLWAGPVSLAIGAEGRRDTLDQRVGALDAARVFATTSFSPAHAHNTTKEGFTEILLPLVRDVPALQKLEFNGAARITDDAIGSIWSWKLGLIDQVSDSLQLRVAHSRDIRAPDLGSLYGRTITSLINISDPQLLQSYTISSTTGANPALESEASLTTTAGVTFTPLSISGLKLSVDHFDIKIENAIATLGAQDVITRCFNGNQALCGTITRGANGRIALVAANLLNLTEIHTAGFDASVEYTMPIERLVSLPGMVGVRSVLTRTTKFDTDDAVSVTNYLGSQNTIPGANAVNGVPKLRWDTTVFYEGERLQTNLRSRYISAGYYDRTRDIANNRIGSYVYFDLGLSVKIPSGIGRLVEAYANIDNLLDKDPPIESRNTPTYDVVGRYYTLGARLNF
jgi:outer membrane receptor protein involved in Fe transport